MKKFYVFSHEHDTIYQYTLSPAWDVSTATYADKSKDVNAQDSTPLSITFKPDGTKMYMVGSSNDRIYQYTLSTIWDMSTASYDSIYKYVGDQDTAPYGVTFKPDGSKMYMVGSQHDTVYQYDLSTLWDVSTATYDYKFKNVNSEDTFPADVTFKPDGSKMYMVGGSNDTVYQYALSTIWDVSTASYDSIYKYVGDQDTAPYGVAFKPDGTKVYILGLNTDTVYQYTLIAPPPAWEVDTAVYEDKYKYIGSEHSSPYGLFINPDGTKMYFVGGDIVFQYTLSTAWEIDTAVYDEKYKDVGNEARYPYYLFFKSDGTKMYIVDQDTQKVFQYALSTPWDVETAVYEDKYKSIIEIAEYPYGLFFRADGLKMYVNKYSAPAKIFQYTLSTAWSVDTATYDNKYKDVNSEDANTRGTFFKPDGTKMYTFGKDTRRAFQYALSTPWEVDTAVYEDKFKYTGDQDGYPVGIFFKPDGGKMYSIGSTTDRVYQYYLVPPAEFEYTGTGTFTYSGTAIVTIGFAYSGIGELTYSGAAFYPIIKFLKATLSIDANKTELSIEANKSELSIYANESELSIEANKSELSIYANESELSIEE